MNADKSAQCEHPSRSLARSRTDSWEHALNAPQTRQRRTEVCNTTEKSWQETSAPACSFPHYRFVGWRLLTKWLAFATLAVGNETETSSQRKYARKTDGTFPFEKRNAETCTLGKRLWVSRTSASPISRSSIAILIDRLTRTKIRNLREVA